MCRLAVLALVCGFLFQLPVSSTERFTSFDHPPFPPTKEEKAVRKAISSYWNSSRKAPSWTQIDFVVADDGKMYEPLIAHSSSDDQYDAECLEAVCAAFPISSTECEAGTTKLKHFFESFGMQCHQAMYLPAYDGREIRTYLDHHQQPQSTEDAFVVVHKIPVCVLDRYPGLFSKNELLSESNLIRIRIGHADPAAKREVGSSTLYATRIPLYYSYFWHLFKENASVTRDALYQCANSADQVINH